LGARPPDSHEIPPDNSTSFSNDVQVADGDMQTFSSSQEVSDYLPQPYKDTTWDDLDDFVVDVDADGEKPVESAYM